MKKILSVYQKLSLYKLQIHLQSKLNFWPLVIGKLMRMVFVLMFYFSLFRFTTSIVGYSLQQILLIFAVYNLIDIVTQALFTRGFWNLQDDVLHGTLDQILIKPVHPLVIITGREIDWMDLTTIFPAVGLLAYSLWVNHIPMYSTTSLIFIGLLCISVMFLLAVNILLASAAIGMVDITQLWFVYNELLKAGQYPPEIFDHIWRLVLTYVVPVFIVFFMPVRFISGTVNLVAIGVFTVITIIGLFIALKVWDRSILHYTSASS